MPIAPSRISRFAKVMVLIAAAAPILAGTAGAGDRLRMATTTSTENSGLLGVLLPPFEKEYGCRVDVIAVGTGKALKLGETGDVDVVFVHARTLEDAFVAGGFGTDRRDVMYNDFVIVGPKEDPAKVSAARNVSEALGRIAAAKAVFVSRGDESGTHQKEKELWRNAGIAPRGGWYLESGLGMGEVIVMATQKRGYALTDRGTYAAYGKKTDLVILSQGNPGLRNPYGIIAVNPARHPHVRHDLAVKLIDFVTGEEGRALIGNFRIGGEQLFFPDPAGKR